jgi:hypothetical protein
MELRSLTLCERSPARLLAACRSETCVGDGEGEVLTDAEAVLACAVP